MRVAIVHGRITTAPRKRDLGRYQRIAVLGVDVPVTVGVGIQGVGTRVQQLIPISPAISIGVGVKGIQSQRLLMRVRQSVTIGVEVIQETCHVGFIAKFTACAALGHRLKTDLRSIQVGKVRNLDSQISESIFVREGTAETFDGFYQIQTKVIHPYNARAHILAGPVHGEGIVHFFEGDRIVDFCTQHFANQGVADSEVHLPGRGQNILYTHVS